MACLKGLHGATTEIFMLPEASEIYGKNTAVESAVQSPLTLNNHFLWGHHRGPRGDLGLTLLTML